MSAEWLACLGVLSHPQQSKRPMSSDDKPGNVTPIRPRRQTQLPRQVDHCPHGVPLDLDCAECHGIKPDDKGEDMPA